MSLGCETKACPYPAALLSLTRSQFRRYHQSDVIVRKANRKAVGWFAGTSEAQAGGQKTTIKRYEGQKDVALKVRVFPCLLRAPRLIRGWILCLSNG